MKTLCLSVLLLFSFNSSAEIFTSSSHRTSVLELYTSEGCNSCPPAEAWISRVDRQGYKPGSVVPLVFHVTYWDYLGWKDKFAKKSSDQRQRKMVSAEGGRTVYTPQFFLNAKTTRSVRRLKTSLDSLSAEKAAVKIWSDVKTTPYDVIVEVRLEPVDKKLQDILHIVVTAYENNLNSSIQAGENEGRKTTHQFVVREMQSSLMSIKGSGKRQFYLKKKPGSNWDGVVVIAEAGNEVIQALNIPLKK